jgi:biopolymer transport protein TolQ
MVHLGSISAFVSAYSQSDFFGKVIFLLLFALSVICWIVLLHKMWLAKKVLKVSRHFASILEKHKDRLLTLDLADLPKMDRRDLPHPYAALFSSLKQKTLEILGKNQFFAQQRGMGKGGAEVYLTREDLDLVESHGLTTLSSQAKHLEKNLFVLSTIVTLAPFVGLLGTVWGILVTFSGLQSGAAAGASSTVLSGISTALATTVLGLVIAIPALVGYNYLRNTVRESHSDMEDFLYFLLSTVELQYRKVEL